MTNPNDPANTVTSGLLDRCGHTGFSPFGLTKREAFAMAAMQGICSYHGTFGLDNNCESVAQRATAMADALIEALNQSPSSK